jgi:UDP:flavonoid glycosyltransferase YjiC (YdhE family)
MIRLAYELSQRGHRVSFAIQEDGRDFVNGTGAKYVSLGRTSMSANDRRDKLKQVLTTTPT